MFSGHQTFLNKTHSKMSGGCWRLPDVSQDDCEKCMVAAKHFLIKIVDGQS
jgi:hypothetical protein